MQVYGISSSPRFCADASRNPLVRMQERYLSLCFPQASPQSIRHMAAEGRKLSLKHLSYLLGGTLVGALAGKAVSKAVPALAKGTRYLSIGTAIGALLGAFGGMLLGLPKMVSGMQRFWATYGDAIWGKR